MSNVKNFSISGKIPYCWAQHQAVQPFLHALSSPNPLKISYTSQEIREIPGSSGKMTYFGFRIDVEEALSDAWIGAFLQALVNAGAEISSPVHIHDIENDCKYALRVLPPDPNDRNTPEIPKTVCRLPYTVQIAPGAAFQGVLEAPSMLELRKLAFILMESTKNEIVWGEVTKTTTYSLGEFIP